MTSLVGFILVYGLLGIAGFFILLEADFLAAALSPPGKTSSGIAVDVVAQRDAAEELERRMVGGLELPGGKRQLPA